MGVDTGPAVRESSQNLVDYDSWFGMFLDRLPDDPNEFASYCQTQHIPCGVHTVRFESPQATATLLQEGYIPSPSQYDVVNEGSTNNWLIDTITDPIRSGGPIPKSTKQRTVETTLNNRFGKDNWKLAALDTVTDNSRAMTEPMISLVFLKKDLAVQRFNLTQQFSRYPHILTKLR